MSARSTSITVYCGVPLNNKYEHTFRHHDYIASSATSSHTFSELSITRVSSNKIRVDYVHGGGFNIFKATYMVINNASREDINYYCFVNEVKYINDVTVEITFEVDVIQTWLTPNLDKVKKSFIDRQHQSNDTIGANLMPEGLELGEHWNNLLADYSLWSHCCIAIDCGFTPNLDADGKFQSVTSVPVDLASGAKVQVGVYPWYFDFNGNGLGNEWTLPVFLKEVGEQGKNASIKNVEIRPYITESVDFAVPQNAGTTGAFINAGDGHSYAPKNNKLWTYPYNYGCLINNCGQEINLKFELFGSHGRFILYKNATTNTPFVIMPADYNGMTPNNNLILNMPVVPTVPFTTDTYAQWWAEQKAGIGWDMVSNLINSVGVINGEAYISGGAISPIFNMLSQSEKQKLNPVSVSGKFTGMDIVGSGLFKFSFICKRITGEFARAIDDYFTMFGYKQNKLAEPHFSNERFAWHYIKTVGFNFQCNCPSADLAKICSIMDSGITFWNTTSIGDYSTTS